MVAEELVQISAAVLDPVQAILAESARRLPGIVAGIIVLLVGYILAAVIAAAVRKVLRRLDFNKWVVEKTGLKKLAGDFRATEFVSLITRWSVFAMFFIPAADLFSLPGFSVFLVQLARWIPQIIGALLVVLFGLCAAEYVSGVIQSTRVKGVKFFADLAKMLILFVAGIMALEQVGIYVDLLKSSFQIILTGAMFGLALAFGIGFGLGLKKEAERLVTKAKKRF